MESNDASRLVRQQQYYSEHGSLSRKLRKLIRAIVVHDAKTPAGMTLPGVYVASRYGTQHRTKTMQSPHLFRF